MRNLKKLLVVVSCLAVLFCMAIYVSAAKWTDVPDDAWYTEAVVKANELGIMNGTSATTFAPLKNLSRAEYVAILFRLSGGEANMEFTFTDVPADAWYKQYVGWAEKAGVITGYGNAQTFGGNHPITREQLMLMTSRFMDYEGIGFNNSDSAVEFKDADKISSWAAVGVEATRKAALITGDANGNFNPQAPATRAEIATIVVRYANKLPEAVDAMHVKYENLLDYLACDEKGKPELHFGKWIPFRENRPDVIGEQILPQLGLSEDKYQITMSDSQFYAFRDTHNQNCYQQRTLVGEASTIPISFSIKNLKTGETTTSKGRVFSVYYDDLTIDGNTYDLGISDELYNALVTNTVQSTGNIARIAKAFEKAEKGEKISIGYIGGSLTAGAGADKNGAWPDSVTDWFRVQYPESEVIGTNAGWGGSNSDYGNTRLQNHILNYDPDIVFIEYATNDGNDDYNRRSFECLVKRCLEYSEDTAVIVVLCYQEGREGRSAVSDAHLAIAEYYDLPVIDMHDGFTAGMNTGKIDVLDFTHDRDHPTTWGHQIKAHMTEYFLKVLRDKAKDASADELKVKPLPSTMLHGDMFMGIQTIDHMNNTDKIVSFGSWEMNVNTNFTNANQYSSPITHKGGNDPLVFKTVGKELYIHSYGAGLDDDGNGEAVIIEITVDGKYKFESNGGDKPYAVTKDLPEGEHTVSVTVKNPNPDDPFVINLINYR